jgi:hypothetical protein
MTNEIDNVQGHMTFKDMRKLAVVSGEKQINTRCVFAVKHNLRHKACFGAGGTLLRTQ